MPELNKEQQLAVEYGNGPLLILAGAGSGKTRVIVHRIASLISKGVNPANILAVTFTNKAAGEMRTRIEKLIGPSARDISLGTFHSIGLRILRREGEAVGLGNNIVVYDDDDQKSLTKKCLEELNIDTKRFQPNAIAEKISRLKDEAISPEEYLVEAEGYYGKIVSQVYKLYQEKLISHQAADFGDLIRLVVDLFGKRPDILERYQKRWQYILVDEYQDTNRAQYLLISMLAANHNNICAVGDDDQSIYRWRGADIRNILEFEKDFENTMVIRLEQNYRSTSNILDAAQAVVANNTGRKKKKLWTKVGAGEKVKLVSNSNEEEEAARIAEKIGSLRMSGYDLKDCSVFYRINAQSRALEDAFRKKRIPYKLIGGVRFYERREIKDVLAYLRVLSHPLDDVSMRRIINVPPRGIGKVSIRRLEAASNGEGIYFALNKIPEKSKAGKTTHALFKALEEIRNEMNRMSLEETIASVIDDSGYAEWIVKEEGGEDRLANINELMTVASKFEIPEGRNPVEAFLDEVALASGIDQWDDETGAVTLMTLHLAKGLEFPNVFIVGLEDGLLPHSRSQDDKDELEEERRLFYVGMTRAKENLFLSHSMNRRLFGKRNYSFPSRFIEELPSDNVVRISASRISPMPTIQTKTDDFDDYFDQRSDDEKIAFALGSHVLHPMFGRGVVKSCVKSTVGHKVTVAFESGAVKRLIAEYAGLRML